MTHIITSLCLRDSACVEVCPVDCIVGGQPESEWPWFYIDPETCIDCGACVPECPYDAIFPEEEVPDAYELSAGQEVQPHSGERYAAKGGEVIDLTEDKPYNYKFFEEGPGYDAAE
ncbi:MAG: ferredoxin family protein [Anaerolineae bacterium]|nr:ferredoxin family protein [Anaerolineae bacterium]